MTSLQERYEWGTLDHPHYSPYINPCDFDLFPKLKEDMRGIGYNDLKEHMDEGTWERLHSNEHRKVTCKRNGSLSQGIYIEGM